MTSFWFSCQCHVKNEGSSTISSIFEPFLPVYKLERCSRFFQASLTI